MQVTWSAIAPAPGSYAIERSISNSGYYQPVGFVSGASTNFVDTTVQGGVSYSYRVIAATDAKGRCQSLLRSGVATATATGTEQPEADVLWGERGQQREHRGLRRDAHLDGCDEQLPAQQQRPL